MRQTKQERMRELARIIYQEGKIIERKVFPEPYAIIEAFGQRYRVENPEGKGVKITQLPRER